MPPGYPGRSSVRRAAVGTARRGTRRRRPRCDGLVSGERDRRERLQAVAGDEEHNAVVAADLARLDRRPERPERHAGGGLSEDARGPREKRHVLADRVLGHGVDGAAGLARGRDGEVAVGRVADRERAGDRVGPNRGYRLPLAERGRDRLAALCLAADLPRRRAVERARARGARENPWPTLWKSAPEAIGIATTSGARQPSCSASSYASVFEPSA